MSLPADVRPSGLLRALAGCFPRHGSGIAAFVFVDDLVALFVGRVDAELDIAIATVRAGVNVDGALLHEGLAGGVGKPHSGAIAEKL